MGTIVNIAAFTVGTNLEDLNVSNAGWSKVTGVGIDNGTGTIRVTNANTPTSAYEGESVTYAYLRTETPGSKTQTVKSVLKKMGAAVGGAVLLLARAQDGDNWIGAYYGDDNTVQLFKSVAGTRSAMTSTTNLTTGLLSSTGDTGTLELEVIYNGVNNTDVKLWWTPNGGSRTQYFTTQNVTDAGLEPIGKVGMWARYSAATSTTGVHFTTFNATDDTAAAALPPPAIRAFPFPILQH